MKNSSTIIYVFAITALLLLFLLLASLLPNFLSEARDAGFGAEYKAGLYVILSLTILPLFSSVWLLVLATRGEKFKTAFRSLIKALAILTVALVILGNIAKYLIRITL
jgi:hypothetical protein